MTTTTMTVLDGTIINVALPQIARALNVSSGAVVWVANGYLLTAAMTLAIFAALASIFGYRNQYAAGLAVFTFASLGCALQPSINALIVMRLLQGLGAAAILRTYPSSLESLLPRLASGGGLSCMTCLVVAWLAMLARAWPALASHRVGV
ncbi:MFS transporter [Massilia sp. DWR3-1-1]|uniref:MFS transporter n=1 Tax=Massilia sp. DWR3-1-1 TaxID=2804559 RepID=UPI003CED523D